MRGEAIGTGVAVGVAARVIVDVLPIRFVNVGYAVPGTDILTGIDLETRPGPPTVLMGPNGSGKTTLLKLAMGLLAPTEGTITFAGAGRAPTGSRAIVLQKPVMLRRTVAQNVGFALAAAGFGASEREVETLLERGQLTKLASRPARRLSGGEQQRLALVRALARQPQVLFLDEPTASLDPHATRLVEEIIGSVAASGVKVVMSTHDIGQARRLAGEVVFLARGRVVERGAAASFFARPRSPEAVDFLAGDLVI